MMLNYLPQRSAAKAAEAKMKQNAPKYNPNSHSSSPFLGNSSASHSSSISHSTSSSSAPSSSARTSSAPKKPLASTIQTARSRIAALDFESSLSERSESEQEAAAQTGMANKSPQPSPTQSGNRNRKTKKPALSFESAMPSSSKASDCSSAESAFAHIRSRSKRSAAQAAQDNIQRSYSELDLDNLSATAQKKARASISSRTPELPKTSRSASTKTDLDDDDFLAHSSNSTSTPKFRPKVSSSQLQKRGRRFHDDHDITWELQSETCQAARYHKWRKCVHCVAKSAGDTCRFVGFRAFAINPTTDEPYPSNSEGSLKPAFLSSPDSDEVMDLPSSRSLASDSLLEAQANVARSLLSVLDAELEHAKQPDILRRPRETTCRQMCEFCATSIFSASWFCRRCGREYCPDCKDAIEQPDSSDALMAKRLTQCDRARAHNAEDLVPLTRFDVALLQQEVVAMRGMLADGKAHASSADTAPRSTVAPKDTDSLKSDSNNEAESKLKWQDIPEERAGLTADRIIGSLPLRTFEGSSFDTHVFRREWAHGEPLLVRDVTVRLQHSWGPDELAARYGDDVCHIIRADTDPPAVEQVSVGEFFSTFGQDSASKEQLVGKGSWKLKDWPPSAEFKHEFPELYDDFNRIVPAPEYTTREGILNLGSCYPAGVIQPDLGPKMYNAWPASEGLRGQGTTRLHMDIADAVNIMLYAPPLTGGDVAEEHKPGVAAWDIFQASDADAIRQFLREEHSGVHFKDDPIHIQRFFISAPQRVKLWRKYGVKSWRIYQKAGEAVFIPAGCAHQVCNLTDCVKVAVDFVSPENVARCFKLTAEFRGLVKDHYKAWKEDVLSLRTTLWYAWCCYREMSGDGPNVWAKEQIERKEEKEKADSMKISRKVVQDA
ncbi:uncharacterized protein MEPE_04411 [Melanopsichium pennsylvanicum]|uniref:JmjC domain-containing protein n=2 Tax=Melanopsichium pennsylvanicum TaxID=63383 RepID=A0AAJ4XNY7_9BASI|nr:clavaminate synthase-like protein [Melanopsichium pennsylvanicum 4]SNX85702.1 uncharacterized protein MEPE_04411 [Melanopsichium pennsylvanicum]